MGSGMGASPLIATVVVVEKEQISIVTWTVLSAGSGSTGTSQIVVPGGTIQSSARDPGTSTLSFAPGRRFCTCTNVDPAHGSDTSSGSGARAGPIFSSRGSDGSSWQSGASACRIEMRSPEAGNGLDRLNHKPSRSNTATSRVPSDARSTVTSRAVDHAVDAD